MCPLATCCWGVAVPYRNRAGQTRGPTTLFDFLSLTVFQLKLNSVSMILTAGVVSGNGSQPRCLQEATLSRFYLAEASRVLDHKERQTQKAVEAHPFL